MKDYKKFKIKSIHRETGYYKNKGSHKIKIHKVDFSFCFIQNKNREYRKINTKNIFKTQKNYSAGCSFSIIGRKRFRGKKQGKN